MTFLPPGYEMPKTNSSYFKIQQGENKLRLLSKPIVGWLDWMEIPGGGKKPVRFPHDKKPLAPINPDQKINHFWTFIIWDYKDDTGKIKIWECTQSSVQTAIQNFSKDSDWGDPYNYDIKIFRTGESAKTRYAVNPVSPKPIDTAIKNAFMAIPINLNALYEGKDPFADVSEQKRTCAFWEQLPSKAETEENLEDMVFSITEQQSSELLTLIQVQITPLDATWIKNFLQACKIASLKLLPSDRFEWAKRQINRKIEDLKKYEDDFDNIPF
jgi:hypothetical protein